MSAGAGSDLLFTTNPTIIAGVLSFLGGFLGGVFSRTAKYWVEKRTRTKKLRRALLQEIKSPESAIKQLNRKSAEENFTPTHTVIPTQIYQSHIDDIGLLSTSEVSHLVDYYAIANVVGEQLETSLEDPDKQDVGSFLEETSTGLNEARDDAERTLTQHTRMWGAFRYKCRKTAGKIRSGIIKRWPDVQAEQALIMNRVHISDGGNQEDKFMWVNVENTEFQVGLELNNGDGFLFDAEVENSAADDLDVQVNVDSPDPIDIDVGQDNDDISGFRSTDIDPDDNGNTSDPVKSGEETFTIGSGQAGRVRICAELDDTADPGSYDISVSINPLSTV